MRKKTTSAARSTTSTKRKITLERTYNASPKDVWGLWTTKKGIESWTGGHGLGNGVRQTGENDSGATVGAGQ